MNYKSIRSIVILAVIAIILMYLKKMETCECVDTELVQRLKFTEIAVGSIIAFNLVANVATGGAYKKAYKKLFFENKVFAVAIVITMLALFEYLVYLIYIYSIDADKCECAEKKSKYLLYAQGAYYTILIGILLFLIYNITV